MITIETDHGTHELPPAMRAHFLNDAGQAIDAGPLSTAEVGEHVAVETEGELVVGRVTARRLEGAA